MPSITVRHNFESAHRLLLLKGKCEAIHGHSFWATITLYGDVDENGILGGIDFGDLKKQFRGHLDSTYDHHLLLNAEDPWAQQLYFPESGRNPMDGPGHAEYLPGLTAIQGDPTTENLAWQIANYMGPLYGLSAEVKVDETAVNAATCWWLPEEGENELHADYNQNQYVTMPE